MLYDFNQPIISNYSPISARGGKRRSKKRYTRKYKKTNNKSKNRLTRRRYR